MNIFSHVSTYASALLLTGLLSVAGAVYAQGDTSTRGAAPPAIILHSGQRFAFLGASITDYGWNHPRGYLRLVVDSLTKNGIAVVPVPAGVGGNTSGDMLARLQHDVIDKKPDWVTIDAGGNDVWHGSVPFDEYMDNMTGIVDKLQKAGIHVILQTCTPIMEDTDSEFNRKMAYYNQFQRYLARQRSCLLCDMNASALAVLKTKSGTDNLLTTDGVHMNDRGDELMATGLLKTLGLTNEQIVASIH